jgi:hypothetical protein
VIGIRVLFSAALSNRLTAPAAAAEDTEKTLVFLYSKVKDGALTLPLGAPPG